MNDTSGTRSGPTRRSALPLLGLLLAAAILPCHALAAVPLSATPSWSSVDSDVATGGALFDVDGDGDLDFITGNGNDISQQRNAVYRNLSGVMLETGAGWHSADAGYHAQLAVGDVNGDGAPDVAVARYGDPFAFQYDRLYYNLGGALETTPSWISGDLDNTFSLALGDPDGDGDLDLAAGCGESYGGTPQRVKLYRNDGGVLTTHPVWQSGSDGYTYDVAWADVDGDGWLDLAAGNEIGANVIYMNLGGALETNPSWSSADANHTLQIDFGDMDGDGWLDMAAADNNQLGGAPARVRIYRNLGGVLETLPSWTSAAVRTYTSCVRWGDADFDGDLDLAAGGWWEPVEVFENLGGVLETTASWSWHPALSNNLVCEQLSWGDVDGAALLTTHETHDGDGSRRLFYTRFRPLHSLDAVHVSGTALAPEEYCYDGEAGWISLASPPPAGAGTLVLDYTYSASLDLAVTNWSTANPSHLFLNTSPVPTAVASAPSASFGLRIAPNPVAGLASVRFRMERGGDAELAVYSMDGRRVRALARRSLGAGPHELAWNGDGEDGRPLPAGVYLVRMQAGGHTETAKVVIAR